jgi:hypothetical protein
MPIPSVDQEAVIAFAMAFGLIAAPHDAVPPRDPGSWWSRQTSSTFA